MRIAIVGAGALGRIYGVHLASMHEVTYVVRPARLEEHGPFRLESAMPLGTARQDAAPRRVDHIPEDAEVALVTLRFDTIAAPDPDLRRSLAAPPRTMVVCLSPVFTAQHETLERLVGGPVISAMPGVSGYLDERDVVRHWVPPIVTTLIDDGTARYGTRAQIMRDEAAQDDVARRARLVEALIEVGLPARLEPDVEAVDAATTTSFFPMIAAIAAGGSVDGLLADRDLLQVVLDAALECERLAPELGKPAPWAPLITRFFRPLTLRAGVGLARLVAPEPVRFLDAHFGPKLRDQHLLMGEHILELARTHAVDAPALRALVERVRAVA